MSVGEDRWAIVPRDENGYAETTNLARLASIASAGYATSFTVLDSDVLSAEIFHDGRSIHEYHSNVGYPCEGYDEDDNPVIFDMLGRAYESYEELPAGPHGADPAAFAPIGVGDVDLAVLGATLRGPGSQAESQHHALLHDLNLTPGPLQVRYDEAIDSGLGV
ncbi:hypothetical protein Areg01_12350 [Actinoplanes regularis]|nr:hypothetical protein Areg01_12350 [Actinoplanes regularis]